MQSKTARLLMEQYSPKAPAIQQKPKPHPWGAKKEAWYRLSLSIIAPRR
jgi:hypothetical protein